MGRGGGRLPPGCLVTSQVNRRLTGGTQQIPLLVATIGGERYVVSMPGEQSE